MTPTDDDERPTGPRPDRDLSPDQWEVLGRAIKVERVARGWERRDLADRAGLSYPYLSEIETGRKRPSTSALSAIAYALGLRPSDLLSVAEDWTESPPEGDAVVSRAIGTHPQWMTGQPDATHPRAPYRGRPYARGRSPSSRRAMLSELLGRIEMLDDDELANVLSLVRSMTQPE